MQVISKYGVRLCEPFAGGWGEIWSADGLPPLSIVELAPRGHVLPGVRGLSVGEERRVAGWKPALHSLGGVFWG